MYDVIIIGGGPAGLTAAIYSGRARLKTLLIESIAITGQAVTASEIENYPGFPKGLNGFEMIEAFRKQAEKFGAEFKREGVKGIKECKSAGKRVYQVEVEGEEILSLSVIIAAGAAPKKLGIPGENEFLGKGVSYCAVCDGAFFKDKAIIVVGGGDTAVEEGLFLTAFGRKVTIVHRRDRLRAAKILQEKAFANKKMDFLWNSVVTEIMGDKKVKSIMIENVKTKKRKEIFTDGVFMLIGYMPNTAFLKDIVRLDADGYVITDEEMKTSKVGVFASGDVRKKLLRQVVTAAGDGATAAFSARNYVEELKGVAYN